MEKKHILFKLLTVEESGLISGGNTQFIATSQTEGKIVNVDGNGRDLKISTGEEKTTNTSNPVSSLDISLVASVNSQSQTRYVVK